MLRAVGETERPHRHADGLRDLDLKILCGRLTLNLLGRGEAQGPAERVLGTVVRDVRSACSEVAGARGCLQLRGEAMLVPSVF